jgi:nicotinamide-nucleotide amidase
MPLDRLTEDATRLLEECRQAGVKLATAESCTGGLIAATLTAIAGSSDVVERGFVTYSNEAKSELLGVAAAVIERHGAVSEAVALAMAEGALSRSRADIAVSVTGIAGPGGATPAKPVGLVHLGCARRGRATVLEHRILAGDRSAVRDQSVVLAFGLIRRQLVVTA